MFNNKYAEENKKLRATVEKYKKELDFYESNSRSANARTSSIEDELHKLQAERDAAVAKNSGYALALAEAYKRVTELEHRIAELTRKLERN